MITPELKSFEDKVLGAREKSLAREREIYDIVLTQPPDDAHVEALQARVDRHFDRLAAVIAGRG